MPWRGRSGQFCKRCDRHVSECGPLSARYRCKECGDGVMVTNIHELRAHGGPSWLRWRRAMAASVGGTLVDDVRDEA